MLDMDLWIGLIILTVVLYGLKWIVSRKRTVKVYRISHKSLQRSKDVMMAVLPLVEDDGDFPLDKTQLRYTKDDIKSAAKILAYFWRRKKAEELSRIKNCFVSISRFQDPNADLETQERRAARERKQLERELDYYMTHSPFNARKGRRE